MSSMSTATNETCLVSRATRRINRTERNAVVGRVPSVDADIRLNHRRADHSAADIMSNRINDRREGSRANEEDQQADKDPGHAAHSAPLSRSQGRTSGGYSAKLARIAKTRAEPKSAVTAET